MNLIKKMTKCPHCNCMQENSFDIGYEPITEYEKKGLRKRLKKSGNTWLREHKCKNNK